MRAIAFTLENVATEPENDGSIIGLSSLNSNVKPIQESLFDEGDKDINELEKSTDNIQESSIPAWALAAGTQLNLTGIKADESKPEKNHVLFHVQRNHKKLYQVCQKNQFPQHYQVQRGIYTDILTTAYLLHP